MIKFGPSGNSTSFYVQGYSRSFETPKWLSSLGLNAYEYSFGRGVNLGEDTAMQIGSEAKKYDVEISVHAPYYINFANPSEEQILKSNAYVLDSLRLLKIMGGNRCVVHPGSLTKQTREEAFENVKRRMSDLVQIVKDSEYSDVLICPETMGRISYIGSVKEIVDICKIDKCLVPTFDFGHINSVTNGSLKTKDDYRKILDILFDGLDEQRAKNIHIHFSKIEYGLKGEIRHLTFADTQYGPEFEPLAELLHEYKMTPFIISESDGTMAEDALKMKQIYESLKK